MESWERIREESWTLEEGRGKRTIKDDKLRVKFIEKDFCERASKEETVKVSIHSRGLIIENNKTKKKWRLISLYDYINKLINKSEVLRSKYRYFQYKPKERNHRNHRWYHGLCITPKLCIINLLMYLFNRPVYVTQKLIPTLVIIKYLWEYDDLHLLETESSTILKSHYRCYSDNDLKQWSVTLKITVLSYEKFFRLTLRTLCKNLSHTRVYTRLYFRTVLP